MINMFSSPCLALHVYHAFSSSTSFLQCKEGNTKHGVGQQPLLKGGSKDINPFKTRFIFNMFWISDFPTLICSHTIIFFLIIFKYMSTI